MNYSTVSQYENVEGPCKVSDSLIYQAIENILTGADSSKNKLFCPLCIDIFDYKFSLMDHLQTTHERFLFEKWDQNIELQQCPFCHAKFFGQHLTAKHTLSNHANVVGAFYSESDSSKNVIRCVYCSLRFKKKSYFKFACHIQEEHFLDFSETFYQKFLHDRDLAEEINSSMTEYDVPDCDIRKESEPTKWSRTPYIFSAKRNTICYDKSDFIEASRINCFDFSELKVQLENIKPPYDSLIGNNQHTKKSILKTKSINEIGKQENQNTVKKSARRNLRFDLPNNSPDKENIAPQQMDSFEVKGLREGSCYSISNTSLAEILCDWDDKPKFSSTPNGSKSLSASEVNKKEKSRDIKSKASFSGRRSNFKSYITKNYFDSCGFQCGKCNYLFQENIELVNHVRKNHKKFTLNLLQPFYQCGLCNARFFKNDYLKKHFKLHSSYYLKKSH